MSSVRLVWGAVPPQERTASVPKGLPCLEPGFPAARVLAVGAFHAIRVGSQQKFRGRSSPGLPDRLMVRGASEAEQTCVQLGRFACQTRSQQMRACSRQSGCGLNVVSTVVPRGRNVAHFSLAKVFVWVVNLRKLGIWKSVTASLCQLPSPCCVCTSRENVTGPTWVGAEERAPGACREGHVPVAGEPQRLF